MALRPDESEDAAINAMIVCTTFRTLHIKIAEGATMFDEVRHDEKLLVVSGFVLTFQKSHSLCPS